MLTLALVEANACNWLKPNWMSANIWLLTDRSLPTLIVDMKFDQICRSSYKPISCSDWHLQPNDHFFLTRDSAYRLIHWWRAFFMPNNKTKRSNCLIALISSFGALTEWSRTIRLVRFRSFDWLSTSHFNIFRPFILTLARGNLRTKWMNGLMVGIIFKIQTMPCFT